MRSRGLLVAGICLVSSLSLAQERGSGGRELLAYDVVIRLHLEPLFPQLATCLQPTEPRLLDVVFRLRRTTSRVRSGYEIDTCYVYRAVLRGSRTADAGTVESPEGPSSEVFSETQTCLRGVIRSVPLPAPQGMEIGSRPYAVNVRLNLGTDAR